MIMAPARYPIVLLGIIVLLVSTFAPLTDEAASAAVAEPPAELRQQIDSALQRRSEAADLGGRITRLVSEGAYQEAEDMLQELLASKQMSDDGHRLLEKVYYHLAVVENLKAWNLWCSERPASHFPFTVRGMYYYERVRQLDGANKTVLLTEKQRRQFNLFLRLAREDLERAVALNSSDPGPVAAFTALAQHLQLSRTEMEAWFQRAVDLDPAWLDNYRAKLLYLAPWWYGSDQKMEQFAGQCFADSRPGSNTYIVALEYLKLKSDRSSNDIQRWGFLLTPSVYQMVSDGFDRYAEDYPHSQEIELYRSLKERALEQPYVAIAAFTDSLNSDPRNTTALKGRITAYLENNQFSEASDDLAVLEELEGKTVFSMVGQAEIAFHLDQDVDRGHHLIDQAIGEETSSYRRKYYYFQRAEFYRSRSIHQQAEADYSAAIAEDVLFEQAYFGRAQSRHASGNLQDSLADLVIIRSSIRGDLVNKARSLMNSYLRTDYSRNRDSVAPLPLAGLSVRPSPDRDSLKEQLPDTGYREYLIRGLRSYYQQSYAEARRDFYRVLSEQPANPTAYFMLGRIGSQHDFNPVRACTFYKEAYRLAPQIPDHLIEMSRCLYRERNFSPAIDLLTTFIEQNDLSSVDDSLSSQLYFIRGLCLEERGLIPEALQDMHRAIELDPGLKAAELFIRDHGQAPSQPIRLSQPADSPEAIVSDREIAERLQRLIEQGQQKLGDNDVAGAKLSYLRAVRLKPEASLPYHHLGNLYFEHERDYDKALLYYNLAIENDNREAAYYYDRAAMHYYFARYEPARADFSTVLQLQPGHP